MKSKTGIKLLLGLLVWQGTPDCLHCAFLTSHLSVLLLWNAGREGCLCCSQFPVSLSLGQGSSLDIVAMEPRGNARCHSTC